ncbi:MAG TPA: hypothetical protein VE842_13370 [Pyrinomonadaceae bacterium]|jgi:hypothetical protein|nr:hypothetical protein [Pyrinomonadaceae bacterium]
MSQVLNIGPKGQRRRKIVGYIVLALTIAGAGLMLFYHAPLWSRFLIFFPAWFAGMEIFQAREKT